MDKYKVTTIGSDVEIALLDKNGGHIYGGNIFDANMTNVGGIGVDGHRCILEVRTGVSRSCPIKHAKDLRAIIGSFPYYVRKKAKDTNRSILNDYKVVAGSVVKDPKCGSYNYDMLGGHIHFGTTIKDLKLASDYLDLYLAVPILLLSNSNNLSIRATYEHFNGKVYGKLSNFKKNDYGFEYRSLPSWAVGYGISKSILCLSWVLMHNLCDLLNKGDSYIPKFSLLSKQATTSYYKGNKSYFMTILPNMIDSIRNMGLYIDYRDEIEHLFGLIKVFNEENKTWDEERCIIDRWKTVEDTYKVSLQKTHFDALSKIVNENTIFDSDIYIYKVNERLLQFSNTIIMHPLIRYGSLWGIQNFSADSHEHNIKIGIGHNLSSDIEKAKQHLKNLLSDQGIKVVQ